MFDANPDLERYYANDPDSRLQKDNGRKVVGYNCQSAVDENHKIIIATDVTNESNDLHQLVNMKEKVDEVKEDLEIDKKTIGVADAGYHAASEIVSLLEDEKFEVYVPNPKDESIKRGKKKKKSTISADGYEVEHFKYDPLSDQFFCPEGNPLERTGTTMDRGIKRIRYTCRHCAHCENRSLCTTQKTGRRISVGENHKEMCEFREKANTELGKKIVQKRKELVEHPFGTIKNILNSGILCKLGLKMPK